MNPERRQALIDVNRERNRQNGLWDWVEHDHQRSPYLWRQMIVTQLERATLAHTEGDEACYRTSMVRAAALALAAVEAFDRAKNADGREADRRALETGS